MPMLESVRFEMAENLLFEVEQKETLGDFFVLKSSFEPEWRKCQILRCVIR